jgi:hypothetical protein
MIEPAGIRKAAGTTQELCLIRLGGSQDIEILCSAQFICDEDFPLGPEAYHNSPCT